MVGLRLRLKDLDVQRMELTVRDGNGGKDRLTVLPQSHPPRTMPGTETNRVRRCCQRLNLSRLTRSQGLLRIWSKPVSGRKPSN